ncbi:MAG: CDP-alcohol phosphatidyltransferase family protein [Actinobacteria bacterium]|nr:CDP-alcohol phosphatidyltransferase family protein [Actinomycetota bacterium]
MRDPTSERPGQGSGNGSPLDRMLGEARGAAEAPSSRRILTIPNLISFSRILLIPLVVVLLVRPGTEYAGLLLLGFVVATDWVDGFVARRTGQVSELGKILDPVADRLIVAAALIALVVRGAFPLWAALLVLVRDGLIVLAGVVLLVWRGARIDVRFVGKVATFTLMFAIPAIAWGNLDLVLGPAARVYGWLWFWVGIVEYYVATALYAGDLAAAARGYDGPR